MSKLINLKICPLFCSRGWAFHFAVVERSMPMRWGEARRGEAKIKYVVTIVPSDALVSPNEIRRARYPFIGRIRVVGKMRAHVEHNYVHMVRTRMIPVAKPIRSNLKFIKENMLSFCGFHFGPTMGDQPQCGRITILSPFQFDHATEDNGCCGEWRQKQNNFTNKYSALLAVPLWRRRQAYQLQPRPHSYAARQRKYYIHFRFKK